MGLRFLEHLLILTHDPEGTRDWFVSNLGFREGYHPEFGFPVYWLYIGDQDVIHIGKARHSEHQDNLPEVAERPGRCRLRGGRRTGLGAHRSPVPEQRRAGGIHHAADPQRR